MKQKDRSLIKYALIGLVVLLCVFIFVFFGSSGGSRRNDAADATPAPSATAEPKGFSLSAFVAALDHGLGACALGEPEQSSSGALVYPLIIPNDDDSGSVTVTTDKLGRVISYELRIRYTDLEGIDDVKDRAAFEVAAPEYVRLAELYDGLIGGQIEAVLDLCAASCGIGSVDRQKLGSAVTEAFRSGAEYNKKFGALRADCVTSRGGQGPEFLLELIFDVSKMK
ncbi:MAG: hypothetical protein II724_04455 [Clostridia bacterium]|nr:hypothetical protein [Clostridia bacterium]